MGFADENLGPKCGPKNMDLCDEEKKKEIETLKTLSFKELHDQIEEQQKELKAADQELEELLKSLQSQYEAGQEKADATKERIKKEGLSLLKSMYAARKKTEKKTE